MSTQPAHESEPRETAALLIGELSSFGRLFYRLLADPRVSAVDKALLFAALAYIVSPVDLIPDALGGKGRIDDLYVFGLVIDRLLVRAGPEILLEHWAGRPGTLRMLIESLDQIASLVPGPVRRVLGGRVGAERHD